MRRFPLRAIVVIKRGETNTIRRLTPAEAADHFFHQTYFPSTIIPDSANQPDAAAATVPGDSVAGQQQAFALRLKALDLMGRLTQLPIYELHCTISQAAIDLTLAALRDNTPEQPTPSSFDEAIIHRHQRKPCKGFSICNHTCKCVDSPPLTLTTIVRPGARLHRHHPSEPYAKAHGQHLPPQPHTPLRSVCGYRKKSASRASTHKNPPAPSPAESYLIQKKSVIIPQPISTFPSEGYRNENTVFSLFVIRKSIWPITSIPITTS